MSTEFMSGVFLDNVKLALSASVGADTVSCTPPQSFIEIRSVAFSAVLRRKFLLRRLSLP
jgi:hypothetical protein